MLLAAEGRRGRECSEAAAAGEVEGGDEVGKVEGGRESRRGRRGRGRGRGRERERKGRSNRSNSMEQGFTREEQEHNKEIPRCCS